MIVVGTAAHFSSMRVIDAAPGVALAIVTRRWLRGVNPTRLSQLIRHRAK
jgi:hypothetical protein